MQKWEYGRLMIYKGNRLEERTWCDRPFPGSIDDFMNKLGSEGWELVAATQVWGTNSDNAQLTYIFKRPL